MPCHPDRVRANYEEPRFGCALHDVKPHEFVTVAFTCGLTRYAKFRVSRQFFVGDMIVVPTGVETMK